MQCYQHLAATLRVAETIDSLYGLRRHMPLNVVSLWMEENDVEADTVLTLNADQLRLLVGQALQRELPAIPRAA